MQCERLDWLLLALKMEGTTTQGVHTVSRSWKRQENGLYPVPYQYLRSNPVRPIWNFYLKTVG